MTRPHDKRFGLWPVLLVSLLVWALALWGLHWAWLTRMR